VLIGKLNLHELPTEAAGYQPFWSRAQPLDTTRITGGSSSGAAAAVATAKCFAALGTDTAGSIRPAGGILRIVG